MNNLVFGPYSLFGPTLAQDLEQSGHRPSWLPAFWIQRLKLCLEYYKRLSQSSTNFLQNLTKVNLQSYKNLTPEMISIMVAKRSGGGTIRLTTYLFRCLLMLMMSRLPSRIPKHSLVRTGLMPRGLTSTWGCSWQGQKTTKKSSNRFMHLLKC